MFDLLATFIKALFKEPPLADEVAERWQVPTGDESFHPFVRPPVEEADTGPSGLIRPRDMKFVHKRWGWESWICNNDKYCGKVLFLKAGRHLSFHHHDVKDEVLYVHQGRMWMTYGEDGGLIHWCEMPAGHAFHVRPGLRHQMQAIEDTYIIEFSTQHFDEDSFRTTTDLVVDHEEDPDEIMR